MFNESYWTNNRDGFRKYFKSFHHPSQYEFFPTTLYVIICFEWYPLKYSVPPPLEQCVHCVFIIANIISAWRFIYYHNPMKLSERNRECGGEYQEWGRKRTQRREGTSKYWNDGKSRVRQRCRLGKIVNMGGWKRDSEVE